jgi:hypothetical protein
MSARFIEDGIRTSRQKQKKYLIVHINSEHRELYSNMGMRIEYTIFLMMRLKSFRPEVDKNEIDVVLKIFDSGMKIQDFN